VRPGLPLLILWCAVSAASADTPPDQRTRAERTQFAQTSRYDDVRAVLDGVAASAPSLVRVTTFGHTEEGRALPLAVLGHPAPDSVEAARRSSRVRVLVLGGIHGGEVEGKEAALIIARRLAGGDLRRVLDRVTVLVAPLYNADGNERISVENRPEQFGPIGGVGRRENSKGADLNRDFVKVETAEGRALAGLLTSWDPHVVIDLHTTNGSYHGYHLTYAPSLAVNADPRLVHVSRALLGSARRVLLDRGWRTYSYGNFVTEGALDKERHRPEAGAPAWRTFDARPRFMTNGIGLRNRIGILSEAYSYLSFERRIRVTEAFVETLLALVARRATAITTLLEQIDRTTADAGRAGTLGSLGTRGRLVPLDGAVPILVGDVETRPHPQTGKPMTVMKEGVATPVLMQDYGSFTPIDVVPAPAAYVVPAGGAAETTAALLDRHGVRYERLAQPETLELELVVPGTVTYGERMVQGRRDVRLGSVTRDRQVVTCAAGSIRVTMGQPLARLAFHLLEPTSDDGLVVWDLVPVKAGEPVPLYRVR
jgi:hypothetical protein